jgi:hypothetical protein
VHAGVRSLASYHVVTQTDTVALGSLPPGLVFPLNDAGTLSSITIVGHRIRALLSVIFIAVPLNAFSQGLPVHHSGFVDAATVVKAQEEALRQAELDTTFTVLTRCCPRILFLQRQATELCAIRVNSF